MRGVFLPLQQWHLGKPQHLQLPREPPSLSQVGISPQGSEPGSPAQGIAISEWKKAPPTESLPLPTWFHVIPTVWEGLMQGSKRINMDQHTPQAWNGWNGPPWYAWWFPGYPPALPDLVYFAATVKRLQHNNIESSWCQWLELSRAA